MVINPQARALLLAAAVLSPAATGVAAAEVGTVAPTPTPAPAVQAPPDQVGQLNLPEDAKYYSDLGSIYQRRPVLGPAGTFDWFYSRQRAPDDPRAFGVISAQPFLSSELTFGSVPGTVALRGSGPSTTQAVAVDGRTWVVDGRRRGTRPGRTVLVGIRDGATRSATRGFADRFYPSDAIPTDRGLRVLGTVSQRVPTRYGTNTKYLAAVTAPGGSKPVALRYVRRSWSNVTALPGGRLLITGAPATETTDPIVIVDRRGRATRLADRRKPGAPLYTGRAGVVRIPEGVVLDEGSKLAQTADLDKSAVVLRSATSGKVMLRRPLSELAFPQAPTCQSPTRQFRAIALSAGPDGLPVLTLACGNTRTETYVPYQGATPYTRTATWDDQYVMVGLRADLTARWWRPATEVGAVPQEYYGYENGCKSSASTAPDGRLILIGCDGALRAVSVPNVGSPQRGALRSTKRDGKQAVRVRIACRGANGTVCSGRVQVLANGVALGTVPYALPARPGAAQGVLDRRVETSEPLPSRITVKLLPRS